MFLDQDKLLLKIRTFNDNMFIDQSGEHGTEFSFLNESSPKKERGAKDNSMMSWLLLLMMILVLILVLIFFEIIDL